MNQIPADGVTVMVTNNRTGAVVFVGSPTSEGDYVEIERGDGKPGQLRMVATERIAQAAARE